MARSAQSKVLSIAHQTMIATVACLISAKRDSGSYDRAGTKPIFTTSTQISPNIVTVKSAAAIASPRRDARARQNGDIHAAGLACDLTDLAHGRVLFSCKVTSYKLASNDVTKPYARRRNHKSTPGYLLHDGVSQSSDAAITSGVRKILSKRSRSINENSIASDCLCLMIVFLSSRVAVSIDPLSTCSTA